MMTWDEIQELVALNKKIRKMGRLKRADNDRLGELRLAYTRYHWSNGVKTIDIPQARTMRRKDYIAATQRNG